MILVHFSLGSFKRHKQYVFKFIKDRFATFYDYGVVFNSFYFLSSSSLLSLNFKSFPRSLTTLETLYD